MHRRMLAPSIVAHAVRCKEHDLRSARLYRNLEGIGDRQGRRYLYSRGEAVRIGLAIFLSRSGFGPRRAFDLIAERWPRIEAHLFDMHARLRDLVLQFDLAPPGFPAQGPYHAALLLNVSSLAEDILSRIDPCARRAAA